MAFTDKQVSAAGDQKVLHNGVLVHAGRKLLVDSAATATATAVAEGYLVNVTTATVYDDGISPLQTYTIQSAGNNRINYNGATKGTGNTIRLDPLLAQTAALVARGWIA